MIPSGAMRRVVFGGAVAVGAYLFRARIAALTASFRTGRTPAPTDSELVDKIAAEVLRNFPAGWVDVNAEDRVVVLRGEVENARHIVDLEDKVGTIEGVIAVENRLRLPDAPPSPTRAATSL